MVRANAERGGCVLIERLFNREHRLPFGEASAIADAEDVRIDCKGFGTKRSIHHDICGFSANARERLKCVPVGRDFTAMITDEEFGKCDNVFGLGVEQADGFDMTFERILTKRNHLCGVFDRFKQQASCLVNADIG